MAKRRRLSSKGAGPILTSTPQLSRVGLTKTPNRQVSFTYDPRKKQQSRHRTQSKRATVAGRFPTATKGDFVFTVESSNADAPRILRSLIDRESRAHIMEAALIAREAKPKEVFDKAGRIKAGSARKWMRETVEWSKEVFGRSAAFREDILQHVQLMSLRGQQAKGQMGDRSAAQRSESADARKFLKSMKRLPAKKPTAPGGGSGSRSDAARKAWVTRRAQGGGKQK